VEGTNVWFLYSKFILASKNQDQTNILIIAYVGNMNSNIKFEDTSGVIRSRKSEDRQYNGQREKDRQYNGQRTNNDVQNIQQKTKDRANEPH